MLTEKVRRKRGGREGGREEKDEGERERKREKEGEKEGGVSKEEKERLRDMHFSLQNDSIHFHLQILLCLCQD